MNFASTHAGTTDTRTPAEQSRDWVPSYPLGYVPRQEPARCLTHTPRELDPRRPIGALSDREAKRARGKSAALRRQRGRA